MPTKWLDKLGLIDTPDPALTDAAYKDLANANRNAGELGRVGAEQNVVEYQDFLKWIRGQAQPYAETGKMGRGILEDNKDFLTKKTGPVTSEDDLIRYISGAENWQKNSLKDQTGIDSLKYDDMAGRKPLTQFGGRDALGGFGGRTPLTNRLNREGLTDTLNREGLTDTMNREGLTNRINRGDLEKFGGRDPTSRWGGHKDRISGKQHQVDDFDPSSVNLEEDPSYQFRKSEAMKAIRRGANAESGARGGATLQALMRRSGEMASQEYGAAYDRALNRYRESRSNRLTERDMALQDYDVNRQNEWRDQDVSLQDYLTNRDTGQINQRTELEDSTFNRGTDMFNKGMQREDSVFNRETNMFNKGMEAEDAGFNRGTNMFNKGMEAEDAGFNRETDTRNQDTQLQDYLTNRDTGQINRQMEAEDYQIQRQTEAQNAQMEMEDYMTNRDTWQQGVNNVDRQVKNSFQIGGWAQNVLNFQNAQFEQQQKEFISGLGQWATQLGQQAEQFMQTQGLMATDRIATYRQMAHESVAAGELGAVGAMLGGVNAFQGAKGQQMAADLGILGMIAGVVGAFGAK